jgi:CubicO group peptidase (beta-lactamase class C family)
LITRPFGRPLFGPSFEGRGFGQGLSPLVDPVVAKTLSSAGEYCWGDAAGTAFWVDPATDLTVVFCTQVISPETTSATRCGGWRTRRSWTETRAKFDGV